MVDHAAREIRSCASTPGRAAFEVREQLWSQADDPSTQILLAREGPQLHDLGGHVGWQPRDGIELRLQFRSAHVLVVHRAEQHHREEEQPADGHARRSRGKAVVFPRAFTKVSVRGVRIDWGGADDATALYY